jgi:osmotically-inducible protein OsmY
MQDVAPIAAMQQIHFGQRIRCSDGEAGLLTQVVFDAGSHRMTDLGVRQGRLFGRSVYVSFATVISAAGESIMLSISRADLAASRKEAPAGALLDSTSVVKTDPTGGTAAQGTIHLIAVYPESGELAYLVAHHLRSRQDTFLRGAYVTKIEAGHVEVTLPEATWQTLPHYHPDGELQQEIEEGLYDLIPLHVDFKGMHIRVLDSVLHLTGNVSSSLWKDIIEDQAMGVQGVVEVKNELLGDETLANSLAMLLGHDPRTRDLPIGVYPRLGIVRLSGSVHNEQQKATAGEIARHCPGVRSVTNTLVVNPKEEMIHVMSSAEGGKGEDLIPGKYVRHTK